MAEQRYVSKYLTHFAGRKEANDDAKYNLLQRIIKSGWLLSGAMANTPTSDLPSRIQQVSYDFPHNLAGVDLNSAFIADVVCFTDIPQSDLRLHMKKFGRFGLSFTKEQLLSKGANPVFYISKRSVDRSEGGITFETLFRKELQNCIDLYTGFQASLVNVKRMFTPDETAQFRMHIFMLKYFLSFLKFWDNTDDDGQESNFYMEREWRIFGGFQFTIQDIQKVLLPREYATFFRRDFPEYTNELLFSEVEL